MIQKMRKKLGCKKGFTLIELIVVIAILGILALIAIPKFAGIQRDAAIKADAATAKQIINSARIYESQKNILSGDATLDNVGTIMTVPAKSQSGAKGAFTLEETAAGSGIYIVKWGTGASYTEGTGAIVEPTE